MSLSKLLSKLLNTGTKSAAGDSCPAGQPPTMHKEHSSIELESIARRSLLRASLDCIYAISQRVIQGAQPGSHGPEMERGSPPDELPFTVDFKTALSFQGELIQREVGPATHIVKRGQNLERVALGHLGGRAREDHVQRHVAEIARLNNLSQHDTLSEGCVLMLPGHTSDGGTVLQTAGESRYTRWADGVLRVEHSDRSGYVRRPQSGGGFSESHWGPRSQDCFEVTRTAQGAYRVNGRSADPTERRVAAARLDTLSDTAELLESSQAFCRRLDSIEENLRQQACEHKQELEWLAEIRKNINELEARARRDGLPPEELASTYHELESMLRSGVKDRSSAAGPLRVTCEVSVQAAHPNKIRAATGLCIATALERRTYAKRPSAAARLIKTIALTGKPDDIDGPAVSVTGRHAAALCCESNRADSIASRWFAESVATILDRLESGTPAEKVDSVADSLTPANPPPRSPVSLSELSNKLTGLHEHNIELAHELSHLPDTVSFGSQAELAYILSHMQTEDTLPVFVRVNADHAEVKDRIDCSESGAAHWHTVAISGFDPTTNKTSIAGQQEPSGEHSLKVRDLYAATLPGQTTESSSESVDPTEQIVLGT